MPTDHEAITQLVYLYAERLDLGDLDGVADLFTHATLRSNHREDGLRGRDAVLGLYRDTVQMHDGIPSTKHVTTNVIVEVDADGTHAGARSYFTVLQARPDLPLQPIIAGRYHDRFERVATGWRFSERMIFVDLVGDLRRHLKMRLPGA